MDSPRKGEGQISKQGSIKMAKNFRQGSKDFPFHFYNGSIRISGGIC